MFQSLTPGRALVVAPYNDQITLATTRFGNLPGCGFWARRDSSSARRPAGPSAASIVLPVGGADVLVDHRRIGVIEEFVEQVGDETLLARRRVGCEAVTASTGRPRACQCSTMARSARRFRRLGMACPPDSYSGDGRAASAASAEHPGPRRSMSTRLCVSASPCTASWCSSPTQSRPSRGDRVCVPTHGDVPFSMCCNRGRRLVALQSGSDQFRVAGVH